MYERNILELLIKRLEEPRRFIQVMLGPRQVGKTTLVQQLEKKCPFPLLYTSADEAQTRDTLWLDTQWQRARQLAHQHKACLLVIDEVQKIKNWSDAVKVAWDSDTRQGLPLHVLVLGSTPLFAGRGIQESLAGRFETIYMPHWSPGEMSEAFNYSADDYLFFGGYPGAAALRGDEPRWRSYMRESIIEATVSRDLLSVVRIEKPALLRRLFFLACEYSGRILSYTKMLGQLHDARNTTTLAHYLELLSQSGLVTGLQKISLEKIRTRASSPKLLALDTSLITATSERSRSDWLTDPAAKGHLIESVVGAHLWREALIKQHSLYYWAEGNLELDFVYQIGKRLLAVEVKSGRRRGTISGLQEFKRRHPNAQAIIVGTGGVPVTEFLQTSPEEWL